MVPETLRATERSGWNWWRLLWYSTIVGIVYTATEFIAVICVGLANALTLPEFDVGDWASRARSDGFVLSVAICAAVSTCVPLVRFLTGRRETRPWNFLGFRRCPARHILFSCVAPAVFIAAADVVSMTLGRQVVPSFLVEAYASARFPVVLFVAMVVAAPILEELLFRGFLFGGLRACGAPIAVAVIVVSAAFAALHTQYRRL
jgi:membrane protease YdiL (CAAX protease family)